MHEHTHGGFRLRAEKKNRSNSQSKKTVQKKMKTKWDEIDVEEFKQWLFIWGTIAVNEFLVCSGKLIIYFEFFIHRILKTKPNNVNGFVLLFWSACIVMSLWLTICERFHVFIRFSRLHKKRQIIAHFQFLIHIFLMSANFAVNRDPLKENGVFLRVESMRFTFIFSVQFDLNLFGDFGSTTSANIA